MDRHSPVGPDNLGRSVEAHGREVYFRKIRFDVFSNPNVEPVLRALRPDHIIVYGVALDLCDAYAIEGFLKRETARLTLVRDASHPIDPARGDALVCEWAAKGVEITTTDEMVGRPSARDPPSEIRADLSARSPGPSTVQPLPKKQTGIPMRDVVPPVSRSPFCNRPPRPDPTSDVAEGAGTEPAAPTEWHS